MALPVRQAGVGACPFVATKGGNAVNALYRLVDGFREVLTDHILFLMIDGFYLNDYIITGVKYIVLVPYQEQHIFLSVETPVKGCFCNKFSLFWSLVKNFRE